MAPELGLANSSSPSLGTPEGSGWVAAVLCVIIALTAGGNSLLILLICTQPALRSTSNYFLVSLFTSDLLVGLVVMPPAMLNELYGRWVLARGLCLLWAAFDIMCCSASILNLCLISLDRYLLILSPLRYKGRMTPGRALALILAAWSLAALASFLPTHMGWHQQGRPAPPNATAEASWAEVAPGGQCRLLASLPFVLVASGLTFFLPSVAISFTYCRILVTARKQAVQVASLASNMEALQVPRTPNFAASTSSENRRFAAKHSKKALKASLTLGILLGMFFVAWLPFFVANVVQSVCDCIPEVFFDVLTWLGYCNSTMNPIIYPLFMRDFKRAMAKFVPCARWAWDRRTSLISLSMRNSHSGAPQFIPQVGFPLQPRMTLPGEVDSATSTLQVIEQPREAQPGHSPPAGTDAVSLFDMDPGEPELKLCALHTPTD
ncbi:5-hydroxytryptamine receptor 6 [Monodelphis domestica]|uniref:5-hydroxytryptamine receptor 6 n=1 Tax=Monodelphis domestica TaxID=13616 RepID=UPI0024E1E6F3|nr:5-hydroxytryptamine receptor 6 [Monodelphis domestica]